MLDEWLHNASTSARIEACRWLDIVLSLVPDAPCADAFRNKLSTESDDDQQSTEFGVTQINVKNLDDLPFFLLPSPVNPKGRCATSLAGSKYFTQKARGDQRWQHLWLCAEHARFHEV